jgi:membrane protease YdiL (CAAX protease family)
VADARYVGLWLLLVIAALEEFIYRGLLIGVCFLLPNGGLMTFALIGNIVAFALSHIWFGWPHVLAKFPLSVVTTAVTLVMGTILPAIIAHLFFNAIFWKDMRSALPPVTST